MSNNKSITLGIVAIGGDLRSKYNDRLGHKSSENTFVNSLFSGLATPPRRP
jgi:hypothetical protein